MTVLDDTALSAAYERQIDVLFEMLVSNLVLAAEKPEMMSDEVAVMCFRTGLQLLRKARSIASGVMA